MTGKRHLTESVEDYLETMYRIEQKGEKVSTTNIASKMGVSAASVSEMMKKLDRFGYVSYTPYKAIGLTRKGRMAGRKMLSRHRVIERFLEGMGMHKHRIHSEAHTLEHYISDEFEDIIKKELEPPKSDSGILSLTEMKNHERGSLISMDAGNRASRRLEDMGLTPGAEVEVTRSAPFSGPVEVRIRDSSLVIGRGMAKKIFVKVDKK